jgi:hypothetical protein
MATFPTPRQYITSMLVLAMGALPSVGFAQQGRLKAKLEGLNVRVRTEHYELAGTVSDRVLQEYGQMLEAIYGEYAAGYSELVGPPPAPKPKPRPRRGKQAHTQPAPPPANAPETARPFRVLVFGTELEYREFGAEFLAVGSEHTTGQFIASVGALLIADQGNPDSTRPILFHEAFHQFMHRYIKDPPVWLNEGLATYYGSAEVGPGGLRIGQSSAGRWKLVRKLIEKGQALPLWDVVQAGRKEFYDRTPVKLSGYGHLARRHLYYAEAFTLIHTLLADATGRERLRNYVRDLAHDAGRNTARITEEYFGPAVCEHMTPYWIAHVQSRPENR